VYLNIEELTYFRLDKKGLFQLENTLFEWTYLPYKEIRIYIKSTDEGVYVVL
jgi:hypothetical protein